ncbi:Gfo/Idh/MocA family oxidoreductase [candidate division KSB1 bacterium]
MQPINRRRFLKTSATTTVGLTVSAPFVKKGFAKNSPNETINIAVVGINGRGKSHYRSFAGIPNVKVATLCDIDERIFAESVADVEKVGGYRPKIETEYRRVLEDKNIDAVSIATPNHWHALQTIWACQAGKDVYVEKPVSHTVVEGRRMVQAARKYNRVVQAGTQSRSSSTVRAAIKFAHDGGLGDVYMSKGLCFKPRGNIGYTKDSPIPKGVNWDAFLGPAPYRPFNQNRYLYKWHWFWDTGNTDLGNQGIHQMDIARWGLNKRVYPVRIHGIGNYFVWKSDQEAPNIQHLVFEYEDGAILQFEVRALATNDEGGTRIGNILFGSKGWMSSDDGYRVHYGEVKIQPSGYSQYSEELGQNFSSGESRKKVPIMGSEGGSHWQNFIDCVRSRRWQDLNGDIQEGHMSSALCHLGNIACRLKRTLSFNPHAEKFVNDDEANSYLTKEYRAPYSLPDEV